MRRTIRTFAILLLLGLGTGAWIKERKPKSHVKAPTTRYHGYALNREAIANAKRFTVLISNEGFEQKSRGTGMLIDSTHILTAAHMIPQNGNEMWVYTFPIHRVLHAKPVFGDSRHDLAVLELDEAVELTRYATFQEKHYDGEPITIIGNILGAMQWYVSYGIISGEWDGYLLMDGTMTHGDSGGPWINEAGEVVGLSDWQLGDEEPSSVVKGGVSAKTINEFLKRWKAPDLGQILQMLLGGGQ
jgi:S1-C subfamily serine protease